MKGLTAWIAGVALAGSLVAPALLRANQGEDREIRYYPGEAARYYPANETSVPCDDEMTMSEAEYVPTDDVDYAPTSDVTYVPTRKVHYVPTSNAVTISEPGTMIAGNRIYYISDNPQYDLSGGSEQIVLIENGTAYRAPTTYTNATFVTALGGYTQPQVVTVPAEYRQDWLAVAAGDRPVRCIPAVAGSMNAVPMNQVTYRRVEPDYATARYVDNGTRYVTRTRTKYVTHKRKSRYSTANAYFVPRERPVEYETVATENPCYTTAATTVASQPMGDLYQIGPTWYMENDGQWLRSDSWRGPFVEVKKGRVPREVRESAKRKHKFEDD